MITKSKRDIAFPYLLLFLCVCLAISLLVAVSLGAVKIPIADTYQIIIKQLFHIGNVDHIAKRKFQDISQSFFDFLEKYLFFYERNLVLLHFRVICIACRYILSI